MATEIKKKYITALGRRKSAQANLRLYTGKSKSQINGQDIDKYFPTPAEKILYEKPQLLTETSQKYYFEAKALGGGKAGQLEALVLAISRALLKANAEFKSVLRANELLTVDARVRQRRHVGTGGKARRTKQSPRR
jgi:small subunit ribosomal protein S9